MSTQQKNILECLSGYISTQIGYTDEDGKNLGKHPVKSYYIRTFIASILAANGLFNDSLVTLIPSMIISPIGIFIMVLAHDLSAFKIKGDDAREAVKKRLRGSPKVFIGMVIITIFIGFLYGVIFSKFDKDIKLPSKEMKSRSTSKGIFETFLIAIACVIALPWGFKNNDTTLLMAIGIATALLPPLVNIGINYGVHFYNKKRMENSEKVIKNSFIYSLLIFLINFITLCAGVYIYLNKDCIKKKK